MANQTADDLHNLLLVFTPFELKAFMEPSNVFTRLVTNAAKVVSPFSRRKCKIKAIDTVAFIKKKLNTSQQLKDKLWHSIIFTLSKNLPTIYSRHSYLVRTVGLCIAT